MSDGYSRRAFLQKTSLAAGALIVGHLPFPARTVRAAGGREGPQLRFGMVSDVHFADIDPGGERFYRQSDRKLSECVEVMNREKVDFVIELGDFKDQDTPPVPARTLGYLRHIEAVFAKFTGPRYHVLGNHDTDSISKEEFLSLALNSGIPGRSTYYAFESAGIRCIVLDACFRSDGSPYGRGNNAWEDSNIPQSELVWLKEQLDSARGPAIVFVHQQLDGQGAYNVRNASEVRKVLRDSGKVLAVFQGHRHEGSYNVLEGIPYYTLQGLIEGGGLENNSYAIVEVRSGSRVTVRGFRRAMSLELWQAPLPALGRPAG